MREGRLDYRTHIKPSALGVLLTPESSHPSSSSWRWILSEVRRFARNSSSYMSFVETKNKFRKRLVENFVPTCLLDRFDRYDPWHCRIAPASISLDPASSSMV